jgi:hypothetical protein
MHLLEQNKYRIRWTWFFSNPSIIEIDYDTIKKRSEPFKEELMKKCFHPDRLVHYFEVYNYDIGEDEYQDYK